MKVISESIENFEIKKYGDLEVYFCVTNRKKFTENEWEEFFDYHDEHTLDVFPNEPLTPRNVRKKWFSEESIIFDKHMWLVLSKDTEEIIGRGFLSFYTEKSPTYEENKATGETFIDVSPRFRGLGIGTDLLRTVTDKALEHKKNKFQSSFIKEQTKMFCKKYNFQIASARNLSRLYLKNVDWTKMESWRSDSKIKNVTIRTFEFVPEDILEEFCNVYTECGKMAPDYDGDYTACEQTTPVAQRESEDKFRKENIRRIAAVSIEEDGTISGFSAVDYDEDNPKEVDQDLTGVLIGYRGRGIAKKLKAEVLFKLREQSLSAEFIETGNNLRNTSMLAINSQMNFKKHCCHYLVTGKVDEIMKSISR